MICSAPFARAAAWQALTNAQLLWEFINNEKKMDESVWDIPLENFFNVKIEVSTQKALEPENEDFIDHIINIFK